MSDAGRCPTQGGVRGREVPTVLHGRKCWWNLLWRRGGLNSLFKEVLSEKEEGSKWRALSITCGNKK